MRKKCVRRTKFVPLTLFAVAVITSMIGTAPGAQGIDPAKLPLLAFSDILYVGGFRLPNTLSNGESFSFGGSQLAYNPARNSLFVGARSRVAEVSIPSVVQSTNPDALPMATFLQGFFDPTEGHLAQIGSDGVNLNSLMVHGGRLYGTAFIYYDAMNTQRASHFSHSLNLSEPSFRGWSAVWAAERTGFVSGAMAAVPDEWQALLGGAAITGQCCIPIVTRTSWGPSAFAFDPSAVGQSLVAASPLLYYTDTHPTLGPWDGANAVFGSTMSMGGVVIVPGTRSVLYFGALGLGTNCYGNGTANPALAGTIGADGEKYCYDPTSSDKGQHAYPYRYQVWAYDLNEFAAVKSGAKQPWQVTPYGVWPFDLPTPAEKVKLGGIGYDQATKTLYVSQLYADKDGYSFRPVIHALRLNAPDGSAASPTPVLSVNVTADKSAPQVAGTSIRFNAAANASGALQYKWRTFDGLNWSDRTGWQSGAEFVDTPTVANPSFRVEVSARTASSTSATGEASASIDFPITAGTGTRVTAVSLAADKSSPQSPGTSVVWRAMADGGAAPQYKFQLFDGATWTTLRDWSTANSYQWTPTVAGANYRVSVWARSSGSTEIYEAVNEAYFVIAAAPTAVPRVATVTIGTTVPSPQTVGTSITWIAVASGGSSPQYKFQLFDGVAWTTVRDWSSSNTYQWIPAKAGSNYRVSVWARSGGSTEIYEAVNEGYFTITGSAAAPPAPRVTAVSLTSDRAAPQLINTTITFKAKPTGGVAPYQYQFQVYDGAKWTPYSWTSSDQFVWTPTVARQNYRIAVWVKSAGNPANLYEASTEVYFEVNKK